MTTYWVGWGGGNNISLKLQVRYFLKISAKKERKKIFFLSFLMTNFCFTDCTKTEKSLKILKSI